MARDYWRGDKVSFLSGFWRVILLPAICGFFGTKAAGNIIGSTADDLVRALVLTEAELVQYYDDIFASQVRNGERSFRDISNLTAQVAANEAGGIFSEGYLVGCWGKQREIYFLGCIWGYILMR